jgi:hypothetical protein
VGSSEKVDYLFYQVARHKLDFELETFLTIRYDEHGQIIAQHDPNKKKREKGGWTTYFVKVKPKKK